MTGIVGGGVLKIQQVTDIMLSIEIYNKKGELCRKRKNIEVRFGQEN